MKCGACGCRNISIKAWQERDSYEGTVTCNGCGKTVFTSRDSLNEVVQYLERKIGEPIKVEA